MYEIQASISNVAELYDTGQFQQAWDTLHRDFTLEQALTNPAVGEELARLLTMFGWVGCKRRLVRELRRRHPENHRIELRWMEDRLAFGDFDTVFDWLHRTRDISDWPAESQHLFWNLRFNMHTEFRDFFKARRALDRALEIQPDNPVMHGDRLHLLVQEDRHQEALDLAVELAERFPNRAAIHHYHAWLLFQLNQEAEALDVFAQTSQRFESPRLTMAWAAAAFDVNRTEHALQAYESFLDRFPNVVPNWKYAAQYKLARTHQRLGNQEQALQHAAQTGQHAEQLVDSLQKGQTPWQQLDVPFQLQSFVTCAPASAAAILNYFGAEVDQDEIASKITYNGTHDDDLKKWLEEAGFVVRPFTLREGLAEELISKQVPFSLSIRYVNSGHRFSVVGYDSCQKSMIILDPGGRYLSSFNEKDALKNFAARGSVGLLILPRSKAAEFADMELPDEQRHLTYLKLCAAVDQGDRELIDQIQAEVEQWEPSPLKWDCVRSIGWHKSDVKMRLESAREAHEKFPEDQMLALRYAEILQTAYQHQDYRDFLQQATQNRNCAGELLARQASSLMHRRGCTEQGWQMFFRSYRKLGSQNSPFAEVAELCLLNPERRHLAMGYARAAATGTPTSEESARGYADLCQQSGNVEEGLRFLRERVERYRHVTSFPTTTLADFLADVGRNGEAMEVLGADPENDDLNSQAWLVQRHVAQLLRWGRLDQAETLLEQKGNLLRPQVMENLRADIERARGDLSAALRHLQASAELAPEGDDIWEQMLDLMWTEEGSEAFRLRCAELLEDSQSTVGTYVGVFAAAFSNWQFDLAHQALDKASDSPPSEVWLAGNRNRVLLSEGRYEEALITCQQLVEEVPYSPAAWMDVATANRGLGKRRQAFEAYQRCWELKPDGESIAIGLLDNADGPEHRREVLKDLQQQCLQRESNGYVIAALSRAAFAEDGVEGVGAWFEQLMEAYPNNEDIVCEYLEMLKNAGRWQQAEAKARAVMEQNPFMPRVGSLWADLLGRLDKVEEQLELLSDLCERFQHRSPLRVDYCMALEGAGEVQRAAQEYKRAMHDFPEAVAVLGCYSEFQWQRGKTNEALQLLERACGLSASYNWAWAKRVEWLELLNRMDEGLEVARHQVRLRPGTSAAHMLLADACRAVGEDDEGVNALQRAMELDPRNVTVRRRIARWHHQYGRTSTALEFLQQCRAELGDLPEFASLEGEMLRHERKWKEARQLLRKSLDQYPDNADAWHTYIDWLDQDDQEQELLTLNRRPPEAVAEDPFLQASIAAMYLRQEEKSKALPYLEQARQKSKDHPWVLRNLLELRRKAKERDELAKLLAEDVEYEGIRPDALAELAASLLWMDDLRWQPAYRALLERRQSRPAEVEVPWEQARNNKQKRALIDWTWQTMQESDDIVFWTSGMWLLLQSKDKKYLNQAMAAFTQRFEQHEEYCGQYAEIMRAPNAKTTKLGRETLRNFLPDPSRDFDLWGIIGYFFGWDPQFVVDNMHDHPFRAEARPWMLSNLADSWIQLGNLEHADDALQQATRWQQDGSYWYLQFNRLQLCFARGEYKQALDINLRINQLSMDDQVRCKTMLKLSKAALASGYFKRRKIMAAHAGEIAPEVIAARKVGEFNTSRDLQLAMWGKLAPGLTVLLWRMGNFGAWINALRFS